MQAPLNTHLPDIFSNLYLQTDNVSMAYSLCSRALFLYHVGGKSCHVIIKWPIFHSPTRFASAS